MGKFEVGQEVTSVGNERKRYIVMASDPDYYGLIPCLRKPMDGLQPVYILKPENVLKEAPMSLVDAIVAYRDACLNPDTDADITDAREKMFDALERELNDD